MAPASKALSPARQSTFLIVEDQYLARRAMARALRAAGHLVTEAEDGDTALAVALSSQNDAIVLDLALPGKSGLEVLRRLREVSRVPVLFVSQADSVETRLEVLQAGADDFLIKPVDLRELQLRLENLVQRSSEAPVANGWKAGDLEVDPIARLVQVGGKPVELTVTEFDLLALLARMPGRLVPRAEMEEVLFRDIPEPGRKANILDVYILRLRRKIGEGRILNRRGVGFLLNG
jgi:DNA-binding response OmpR family regulator